MVTIYYFEGFVMAVENASKKYALARLRHRIEANKRQMRMLGIRLAGESSIDLRAQMSESNIQPLAN